MLDLYFQQVNFHLHVSLRYLEVSLQFAYLWQCKVQEDHHNPPLHRNHDHHDHNLTCPSVSWPLGGTLACCTSLPPTPLLDPVGDLTNHVTIVIVIIIINIIIVVVVIIIIIIVMIIVINLTSIL